MQTASVAPRLSPRNRALRPTTAPFPAVCIAAVFIPAWLGLTAGVAVSAAHPTPRGAPLFAVATPSAAVRALLLRSALVTAFYSLAAGARPFPLPAPRSTPPTPLSRPVSSFRAVATAPASGTLARPRLLHHATSCITMRHASCLFPHASRLIMDRHESSRIVMRRRHRRAQAGS